MSRPDREKMPYRDCVGTAVFNRQGLVLIGRRQSAGDPEDSAEFGSPWQMPQGGIDKGETPIEAACRELGEEVGTTKALFLRESRDWIRYDVPSRVAPGNWKGKWRGQTQKWFALAFTGRDSDIDIAAHGHEFDDWRWVPAHELPGLIVPFKRAVYEAVLTEFADLVA